MKVCNYCGKGILKKENIYCGSSCAAKVNNKGKCRNKAYFEKLYPSREKKFWKTRPPTEFIKDPLGGNHKAILIQERGYRCESCKRRKWLKREIVLELEHIDGDKSNCLRENLKLLCPNCHSLTPTWKGRKNKGVWKRRYSEETVLQVLSESKNMNQCLRKLNLSWGSGETIIKIMLKHKIGFNGLPLC